MIDRDGIRLLILSIAGEFELDPQLVSAVVLQESGGRPFAMRYEQAFFIRYVRDVPIDQMKGFIPDPRLVSLATERSLRAHSFGLMQMMGQVAREFGFKRLDLGDLLDPTINLKLGCHILRFHIEKQGSVEKGLVRWNGSERYAHEVMARIDSGESNAYLRPSS